jgi:hypothetical protein
MLWWLLYNGHPENGLHRSAVIGSMLIIGGVLAGIGVPGAIEAIRPLLGKAP